MNQIPHHCIAIGDLDSFDVQPEPYEVIIGNRKTILRFKPDHTISLVEDGLERLLGSDQDVIAGLRHLVRCLIFHPMGSGHDALRSDMREMCCPLCEGSGIVLAPKNHPQPDEKTRA